MMRFILCMCFLYYFAFGVSQTECMAIFEIRKNEIFKELEKIDEAKKNADALIKANTQIYEKKLENLKIEQDKNQKILDQIKEQNASLEKNKKENEALLKQIDQITNSKLIEAYDKMKDAAAASILANLSDSEAAEILYKLQPKKVSKILAKMDPAKASDITILLKAGPPFKEKETNLQTNKNSE